MDANRGAPLDSLLPSNLPQQTKSKELFVDSLVICQFLNIDRILMRFHKLVVYSKYLSSHCLFYHPRMWAMTFKGQTDPN